MKSAVLKAAILEVLADLDEPAPERYIMLLLCVEYRAKVSYSELRTALRKLDEPKCVTGSQSCDETMVWSISARGKAWLAELR